MTHERRTQIKEELARYTTKHNLSAMLEEAMQDAEFWREAVRGFDNPYRGNVNRRGSYPDATCLFCFETRDFPIEIHSPEAHKPNCKFFLSLK